jgi:hypothetical protein
MSKEDTRFECTGKPVDFIDMQNPDSTIATVWTCRMINGDARPART